jgi:phage tail sheath gpL-like
MPVDFAQFPDNWRLPLWWLEVDPSKAGLPVQRPKALLVGYALATAQVVTNNQLDVPIPIGELAQATALFGSGSMLEAMFAAFFANSYGQLVYGVAITHPASAVAASGTITIATPPTDAGTLVIYIAGTKISILVGATDTATTIAANLAAQINTAPTLGQLGLPVKATAAAAIVTLTCNWPDVTGNDIDIRDNYLGSPGAEVLPDGVTLTYSHPNSAVWPGSAGGKLGGGTGVADCSACIINMGEEDYQYVAMPFTDTANMNAWDTEYNSGDNGRWGWMRQLYGVIFSARRDIFSGAITWGEGNNRFTISTMCFETNSPSSGWQWAAAYCSKAARALLNDPARPLQTLELTSIKPAPFHQRFIKSEQNSINLWGQAVQTVDPNGIPMIMRESTQYQLNQYGQSDDAYELVTTLATLARLFTNQRQAITSKYPRHKLADDGTKFGPGQAILTPSMAKAELIAEYAEDEYNGLVENSTAYIQNLIVQRNPNNPNRLDVVYPPDLVNQLRIFAVLAQFRLQYDRGVDINIIGPITP